MAKKLRNSAPRLSRSQIPTHAANYRNWAVPATDAWSTKQREYYSRIVPALKAYLDFEKVEVIEETWGFSVAQLMEALARTQMLDVMGVPFGFCALKKNLHLRPGERVAELPRSLSPKAGECRGSFARLLKAEDLRQEFTDRFLGKSPGGLRHTAVTMQEWLTKVLRARGYKDTDYPFTTKTALYSSVAALCNKISRKNRDEYLRAYGTDREITNLGVMDGTKTPRPRAKPFFAVEADEHKLHIICNVVMEVDGVRFHIPGERISGVIIRDDHSTAIVGASICLSPEVKEEALNRAMQSAVDPNYVVLLSNGEPAPRFRPCDIHPGIGGFLWSVMYLDNAKIHTSDRTLTTVDRIGATICFGPLYSWSGRPDVEGGYRQISREFDRMPGATSSVPLFAGRGSPAERAIEEETTIVEVERCFFEIIAHLNTTPSESIVNHKPADYLRQLARESDRLLRQLPPPTAHNPEVGCFSYLVKVKRRGRDNANLYINFDSVKYTGELLSKRGDLEGCDIIIHVRRNLRTVEAFETSGFTIGTLTADGKWGKSDHDEGLRRAVFSRKHFRRNDPDRSERGPEELIARRAANVLKAAKHRPPGGVVPDATQLHRDSTYTTDGVIRVDTVASQDSSPNEQELSSKMSMREAADRAKRMREARERQEQGPTE